MNQTDRYVLAGGGTGGHLYPGLAIAEEILREDPTAEIEFWTTRRPLDQQLLSRTRYRQQIQAVRPFSMRPWHWPGFLLAWRFAVEAAARSFAQRPPRVVLGLGGYAGAPPVAAARRLGIRTAILNPDAAPGRANRFLATRCDLVICQWDATLAHFPRNVRCRSLGCPIRSEFASACASDGVRIFELDPARPVLVVTGASQGAHSINAAVCKVWKEFSEARPEWQLVHLSGKADEAFVRQAHGGDPNVRVVAFTHDMAALLAAADVVVSRAGASTLAELLALAKPSILLPYPYHRDKHQHANAGVLVQAGAAVLIEDAIDPDRNAAPLLSALQRLADPAVRQMMREAAKPLGRPTAAASVARWMVGSHAKPFLL